jgi:hypothetical protein
MTHLNAIAEVFVTPVIMFHSGNIPEPLPSFADQIDSDGESDYSQACLPTEVEWLLQFVPDFIQPGASDLSQKISQF